jgi:creatinine amidohydrolase
VTLILTVRDVIKEFARHGVRKLAVMVGHYENTMFTIEGIDLALRDLRADGIRDMKIVRADYRDFTSPETIARVWNEGFPGWATEHAGTMETSLMLHLHPELVDMKAVPMHPPACLPPYDVYPVNPDSVPSSDALCSAAQATAEKGKMLLDEYADAISKALAGEFELLGGGQRKAAKAAE